jgi:pimeloyl-ACP methyl ester carboxylesterase
MRFSKRYILEIFLLITALNIYAQEKRVIENDIIVNSHKMHYYLLGKGAVTIVVDVGIGNTYRDWLPFLNKITNEVQIFCYDRAGYGQSEIGKMPRDSRTEADDLKALLKKAKIKGPYILLGHSLGALNLQIFASQYKTDVAAMLLLDPPPLDWIMGKGFPKLKSLAEQTTKSFENNYENLKYSADAGDRRRADFFKTLASEHGEMFSGSAKQAASITSFGDIPFIVIASGKPNTQMGDEAEAFQKFWNDQCKLLSSKSKRGKYELAAESSHHIYRDDPEIVLKALNKLLKDI